MVEVTLFRNMRKDVNSTARPGSGDYDSSTIYSCEIFEPCSVQSPKIWVAVALNADIHNYNYAYIPHFSRYYWVTDLSFMDGRWLFSLSCDVLASFKNDIGSSEQYVLRSETDYNEKIKDTIYTPAAAPVQVYNADLSSAQLADDLKTGYYIIGVSSALSAVGSNIGTTYYIGMSPNQMGYFANSLLSNPAYLNIDPDDMSANVTKAILNPLQYIQSAKWIPIPFAGPQEYVLKFGWWDVSIPYGYTPALTDSNNDARNVLSRTFTWTVPKHPQASTHGSFLNFAPYSRYELELPCAGRFDIPADLLFDAVTVKATMQLDIVTGLARVYIVAYDEDSLHSWEIMATNCELSIDIPLAQLTNNAVGALKAGAGAVAGAVGNFLSGNIVGGISSLVSGGIDASIAYKTPIADFIGTAGNMAQFRTIPGLYYTYLPMTGTAFNLFGRPLCEKRIINTLTGFTMCGRAHLALPGATIAETEEAERYLNEGFRYE